MALRTDAPEVCAIIDTDLTGDTVLPFITTASVLVDEHLTSETPALSDDLLKQIEMYLAAHFITLWDPRALKEEAGDTKFTYEGKTGEGLDSSRYGQMAQTLDPTGKLSGLNDPDRISFVARVGNERDVENL